MKKTFYYSIFIIILILISVGIVDSIKLLSNDLNNHLWVSFIGKWQCREKSYYEIEFNMDETFIEYYYEVRKSTGTVKIVNDQIVLVYDKESCKLKGLTKCTVNVSYLFQFDTLVLLIDGNKLTFYRENN